VEYLFFARILALCRARGITIPTIRLGVIECKLPKRIVGIVITRARHSAKITHRIGKKLFQSSRTYAVKWQFLAENQPSGKLDRSDIQEQSMLSNST
jgi:hypothetical protein